MAKSGKRSASTVQPVSRWKPQRLLDPIYGLIPFDDNPLDRAAWELIQTPEFQRLRRIKQLGFSEYVFPGATHSRFAHSIGVFHNARRLSKLLERQKYSNPDRHFETCIAALLHDVGHGPFSHTFERVQERIGKKKKHELWTSEIILSLDRNITPELNSNTIKKIAVQVKNKDPSDIFDSIVASQFDADRLDYLVRDRYMTGVGLGEFDIDWLLDAVRVGKVALEHNEKDGLTKVDGLYLSEKSIRAAEGYLLARFHMYEQVYLHKTTRCMEAMFGKLLEDLSVLVKGGDGDAFGLDKDSSLGKFLAGEELDVMAYAQLDDLSVWSHIIFVSRLESSPVSQLALRLANRDLYKCIDIGRLSGGQDDVIMKFRIALKEFRKENPEVVILEDQTDLSPYKLHRYDEPGAFQKVLVGKDSGEHDLPPDIAKRSKIVESLAPVNLFRVYVENQDVKNKIEAIRRSVANG